MSVPRVAVVLPCWNAARYLDKALASLACQTFTDFEVIAVDDGSTDETPRLLEAWAERDARLSFLRRGHQGLVAAFNAGLERVRGPLVAVGAAGARELIRAELAERGWREPEDYRTMA